MGEIKMDKKIAVLQGEFGLSDQSRKHFQEVARHYGSELIVFDTKIKPYNAETLEEDKLKEAIKTLQGLEVIMIDDDSFGKDSLQALLPHTESIQYLQDKAKELINDPVTAIYFVQKLKKASELLPFQIPALTYFTKTQKLSSAFIQVLLQNEFDWTFTNYLKFSIRNYTAPETDAKVLERLVGIKGSGSD